MRLPTVGSVLLSVLYAVVQVLCISQRDAGVHDWHMELVGLPKVESGASPRFHYPAGPSNTGVSSLVYTSTQRNVLAALDPKTGVVAWRHLFPTDQPILRYEVHGEAIIALTGPGGAQIHLLSATTGHLRWSLNLHSPSEGLLPEPASIAADVAFYQVSKEVDAGFDILSVANGQTLRRINGMTGQTAWSWQLDRTTDPTTQIFSVIPPAPGSNALQVLLIKRTVGSYALWLATLSRTGELLRPATLVKGSDFEKLESLLAFPPLQDTVENRVVYLDKYGDVKCLFLFPDGTRDPIATTFKPSSKYDTLENISLLEKGIFIGRRLDGTGSVLEAASDGSTHVLHEFSDAVDKSVFSGFVDRDSITHISRYSISTVLGLARMSTFTVEKTDYNDAGMVFDSTFPYQPKKSGQILHATAEVAPRKSASLLFRLCVTTASGTFQGWLGGGMQWSREEGLAQLSYEDSDPSIVFIEAPSKAAITSASLLLPTLNTFRSILSLPLRAFSLLQPTKELSTRTSRDWLSEAFGYRKLAVFGTQYGKLYALDLGDGGRIVWETYLVPLSVTSGDKVITWKELIAHTRSDGKILLVAIAEIVSADDQYRVQVSYLDGLTGKPMLRSGSEEILLHEPIKTVFTTEDSTQPAFLLVSSDLRSIHERDLPSSLSPVHTANTRPHITFPTILDGGEIEGRHAILSSGNNPVKTEVVWRRHAAEGGRIVAIAKQINGRIASAGRVLGDRTTLHKYINVHLLAVATAIVADDTVAIQVIDSVSGDIVWETTHSGEADVSAAVSVTLTENWLVYAFADKTAEGKETRIVSVELFEGNQSSTKHLSEVSSFGRMAPIAVAKSFVYPGAIQSLATSQTKHGVTTKSLLVTTGTDQIVAIPRRYLDPRRPMQKPTKSEMEEFLIPYDPVLPIEAKWVVSHRNRILGITGIMASSTILESTSQILAFGLDLFGSSVSPSGRFDVLSQEFNKLQLIGTTLGLLVAIGVLKPVVQKKKLKERWYPAS